MVAFTILSPLDQPLGRRRLLQVLKDKLSSDKFSSFGISIAFAKIGPLYRLQDSILKWHKAGKNSSAIFGIDHKGTSKQALEFAVSHLNNVYYTQYKGHSFHPKIYWFEGKSDGVIFIGSNNLTVGGTELNFEAGIELIFKLPDESKEFEEAKASYLDLLHTTCLATRPLNMVAIGALDAAGLLMDETKKPLPGTGWSAKTAHTPSSGGKMPFKPQSSLPSSIIFGKPPKKAALAKTAAAIATQAKVINITKPFVPVSGVAMQIRPHHNGEIFLSKTAAQQNPAFFGMPFTGSTTPKIASNAASPQRVPDPICNITVFGAANTVLHSMTKYALNMIFYESKAEIRVTASPLVPYVPEYSILVICPTDEVGVDYEMQIFTQASPDFPQWLLVCDQEMPGGGKVPRKFGWF